MANAAVAAPDPHNTNLSEFHQLDIFEELAGHHGSFTKIKRLADAIHGKVLQCQWVRDGHPPEVVVAKKMTRQNVMLNVDRETNDQVCHRNPGARARELEDALTEISVLNYLSRQPDLPCYLLRMLGAFTTTEAQVEFALLITEFIEGGELFAQVSSGSLDSSEDTVRGLMWQLLQGTRYLHQHHIGHRDISLENILITFRDNPSGHVRLMDFGQAVRTSSANGAVLLRYFSFVGKPYYRGPECYVPKAAQVRIRAPRAASAHEILFIKLTTPNDGYMCEVRVPNQVVTGEACLADVWGYTVPPLDIFSLGVCFFILSWRAPPWGRALLVDPSFAFICSRGLEALLNHWKKQPLSPSAMRLLVAMVTADPAKRPSAVDCLADEWFRPFEGKEIPRHPPGPDQARQLQQDSQHSIPQSAQSSNQLQCGHRLDDLQESCSTCQAFSESKSHQLQRPSNVEAEGSNGHVPAERSEGDDTDAMPDLSQLNLNTASENRNRSSNGLQLPSAAVSR